MPYLIDLGLNSLNSLTDLVFGPLIEMAILEQSKLYLAGNPLNCDCSIAWLVRNASLLAPVVGARCDGDGISIGDVNWDQFKKCRPTKRAPSGTTKTKSD